MFFTNIHLFVLYFASKMTKVPGKTVTIGTLFNMGQTRPLFVYFRPFHNKITTIGLNFISLFAKKMADLDVVLGIRIWGHNIVGTDETTQLW